MNASTKLQKAGRTFLLRLVGENGAEEAAQILRTLANELDGLAEERIRAEGKKVGRLFPYRFRTEPPQVR